MTVSSGAESTPRRFKRFPPGSGNLRVPVDSRADAEATIALWPACRPSAVIARRVARTAVRLFGPLAIPGRARPWRPPTGEPAWRELLERWGSTVGEIEAWSIYERPQAEREGFAALLLRDGLPLGFAKLRTDPAPIDREWDAMRAMRAARPTTFEVPEPLEKGAAGEWRWWLSRALPLGLHAPPIEPPLSAITGEIGAALRALPRASTVPDHWTPMHGDFTPWNLRDSGGRLLLIDWEDAGWGPPSADLVLYRAVEAALGGARRPVEGAGEAIGYWLGTLDPASGDARDRRLARGLEGALRWMEARA